MMGISDRDRRIITILTIFTIIFTFFGASLAYWNWETSEAQRTNVAFTVTQDFTCSVDGGGNITQTDAFIAPSTCTNSEHAIKRTVTVNPEVLKDNINVNLDLWIEVKSLQEGLKNSDNFRYALTTDSSSCESGVVSSGNLKNLTTGDTKTILKKNYGATTTDTYYLWVWLDSVETSQTTMDQSFSLTLGGECTNTLSPNAPVLDDGMIPVTIANNGTVTTVSSMDENWYDYENKEWANVVLVKEEGTQLRSYYKNNPGKTVNQEDILAYYVWIPKYSYRIPTLYCSDVEGINETDYPECYKYILTSEDKETFIEYWYNSNLWMEESYGIDYTLERATEEVETMLNTGYVYIEEVAYLFTFVEILSWYNDENNPDITYTSNLEPNNMVNGPREIDISFEAKNASKETGDAVDTYRTHPAFTFGTEELSGIWVGKFETSHSSLASSTTSNNLGCTNENCTNADGLIIKPNVQSLRRNNVSNQFYASRSMTRSENPFGLSSSQTDSHMMKNSEWGAVAYLSHSKYGINREIYINNSSNYYTGRSGGNIGSDSTTTSTGGSYTWLGQPVTGTTTYGTVTDSTLGTNASTTGNVTGVYDMSGGADEYVMGNYANTKGGSGFTTLPNSKYYDLYTSSNPLTACNGGVCFGHALFETSGWYKDYADFVSSGNPWFRRGGHYRSGAGAGAFTSACSGGFADGLYSFRSVAIIGT